MNPSSSLLQKVLWSGVTNSGYYPKTNFGLNPHPIVQIIFQLSYDLLRESLFDTHIRNSFRSLTFRKHTTWIPAAAIASSSVILCWKNITWRPTSYLLHLVRFKVRIKICIGIVHRERSMRCKLLLPLKRWSSSKFLTQSIKPGISAQAV